MINSPTVKRWLAAGATVLAVGGGGTLAMAQSGGHNNTATTQVPTTQRADTPERGDRPDAANDRSEANDVNEARDANEANDVERADGKEARESEKNGGNEAAEAANLARIATVTRTQAEQTALGRVPGTVNDATLGDENGTAIWEVHVKADSGRDQEVKVNAKTGTVLPLEADAGN